MIQELLTEYIVDEEMNQDDVEFAAKALVHKANQNQRGSRGNQLIMSPKGSGNLKRPHATKLSLQKKVTWRKREASIVDMMMQTGSHEEAKGEHVFAPAVDMGLDGTITEEQESQFSHLDLNKQAANSSNKF